MAKRTDYWREYKRKKRRETLFNSCKNSQERYELSKVFHDIECLPAHLKGYFMAVPNDADTNEESLNDYLAHVDESIELHSNRLTELDTKIAAQTELLNAINAKIEAQGKATLPTVPEKQEEKPATPTTPQVNVSEGAKFRFIRKKNGQIVKRRVQ